ncbi:hypothetical protein [Kitasatospora herbaricolor]|uniref:hypothetical protein n=1 Tax=Kitasatospora herbaricolor TaxID=68217 RepID=UPI0036DA2083
MRSDDAEDGAGAGPRSDDDVVDEAAREATAGCAGPEADADAGDALGVPLTFAACDGNADHTTGSGGAPGVPLAPATSEGTTGDPPDVPLTSAVCDGNADDTTAADEAPDAAGGLSPGPTGVAAAVGDSRAGEPLGDAASTGDGISRDAGTPTVAGAVGLAEGADGSAGDGSTFDEGRAVGVKLGTAFCAGMRLVAAGAVAAVAAVAAACGTPTAGESDGRCDMGPATAVAGGTDAGSTRRVGAEDARALSVRNS